MTKNLSLIFFLLLMTTISLAQAPEKMTFQAVVRDSINLIASNQLIGMRINIIQSNPTGLIVYSETHNINTNASGLITLEIGTGNVISGSFSLINWGNGPYFIETETDPTGGTNYTVIGTSQMLSVPYALHAKTANSIQGGINETDPVYGASIASSITAVDTANWNSKLSVEVDGSVTNELQTLGISNDTIFLTNGGFVRLPAAYIGNNTDNQILSVSGDTLSISGGNQVLLNPSGSPYDKRTLIDLRFSANTSSTSWITGLAYFEFNKTNFVNIDSITFLSTPYVGVWTNQSIVELINLDTGTPITGTTLQSSNSTLNTITSFRETGNIYNQLPSGTFTLGIRMKSLLWNQFAGIGYSYLVIYRN